MSRTPDRSAHPSRFLGRRQFLIGAGSVTLSLPPLLSVMSKVAAAQTMNPVKRLICLPTLYGISPSMFFPPTPPGAAETKRATPDVPIYTTPLSGSGSPFQLGYTSDASGIAALGKAFQPLLPKMNLYQGLDYAVDGSSTIGHTYGPLGANCVSSGTDFSSKAGGRSIGFGQSIDNVVAKSPRFYSAPAAVPVLRMSSTVDGQNFSYSRASVNTSPADPTYEDFTLGDSEAFARVFANLPTPSSSPSSSVAATKLTILDTFLQDYKTLRSNPRLSAADQKLLDGYIAGIGDLEARIRATQSAAAACSTTSIEALQGQLQVSANNQVYYGFPGQDTSGHTTGVTSCLKMMQNMNTIIQSAFICDLTRIVVLANEIFQDAVLDGYTIGSEFHCHVATQDGPMHAWFLNNVVAAMAALLDSTPDPFNPGTTLLDNTVILFTNEHSGGDAQHSGKSLPIMTLGSGGGALQTGYYFDCRQRPYTGTPYTYDLGRPYAQLLVSIMTALGLLPSDYSVGGDGNPTGFGDFNGATDYKAFTATHNSPLPFVNV